MTQKTNKNLKKISYTIKEFNIDERAEFLDHVWENLDKNKFSLFVWVLRTATDIKDEVLNEMPSEDIIELAKIVSEKINKKK
tara:strand:+ start:2164 stop:2409 length:246 start_codon:yes stop_codon:yes gene_type:complete